MDAIPVIGNTVHWPLLVINERLVGALEPTQTSPKLPVLAIIRFALGRRHDTGDGTIWSWPGRR